MALLLTRQDLAPFDAETAKKVDVSKGAYVISDDEETDIVFIATGSEVNLALEAAKILRESGVGVRVVSMPSQELFLEQDYDYQDSVLPPDCMCYVSIEAGSTFGWHRFIGRDGLAIGLDHFGAFGSVQGAGQRVRFHAGRGDRADQGSLHLLRGGRRLRLRLRL